MTSFLTLQLTLVVCIPGRREGGSVVEIEEILPHNDDVCVSKGEVRLLRGVLVGSLCGEFFSGRHSRELLWGVIYGRHLGESLLGFIAGSRCWE
jgi:hypothetical protein